MKISLNNFLKKDSFFDKVDDAINGENSEVNFDSIFLVYKDYILQLLQNDELLAKIDDFIKANGEFDVYDDGELNDFLFAVSQTIQGLLLQNSNLGNVAEPDSFYEMFKIFLERAKSLDV